MSKPSSGSLFKDALNHIKNDINYPASKQDIMKACSGFSEIPENERNWFNNNLPDRTYNTAQEVVTSLFDKI